MIEKLGKGAAFIINKGFLVAAFATVGALLTFFALYRGHRHQSVALAYATAALFFYALACPQQALAADAPEPLLAAVPAR